MTTAEAPRGAGRLALPFTIALVVLIAIAALRVFVDPNADLRRAEAAARAAQPPAVRAQLAKTAIQASPLDGRGYRLLAEAALAEHDDAKAAQLFALAAARGPRDLPSQAWLANRALAAGDFAEALSRMDKMLRIEPQLGNNIYPVMMAVALRATAQPALAKILVAQPPWRGAFLSNLLRSIPDSNAVQGLIDTIRHAPGGLAPDELGWWLDRLASEHRWGAAYISWAESLDAADRAQIGNVYNGSFETEPSQLGFDWRFNNVPGAHISREQVTGATGSLALHVTFEDRRVPFQNVRQLLALAPGDYRFTGRSRLDQLRTERGLVWTVRCADDGRVLAETAPFLGSHPWSDFVLSVTVPDSGCAGQWLLLRLPARIPAEQRIGGAAWFDGLEMQREPQE